MWRSADGSRAPRIRRSAPLRCPAAGPGPLAPGRRGTRRRRCPGRLRGRLGAGDGALPWTAAPRAWLAGVVRKRSLKVLRSEANARAGIGVPSCVSGPRQWAAGGDGLSPECSRVPSGASSERFWGEGGRPAARSSAPTSSIGDSDKPSPDRSHASERTTASPDTTTNAWGETSQERRGFSSSTGRSIGRPLVSLGSRAARSPLAAHRASASLGIRALPSTGRTATPSWHPRAGTRAA